MIEYTVMGCSFGSSAADLRRVKSEAARAFPDDANKKSDREVCLVWMRI
ncbi:hypothetical protein HY489_00290 [Candidatus Woesearchaeota archaeon]|nr:hypothetical protein [Candidatus Woesearchaeota archaeon]